MKQLSGKVALITGAGQGIGRRIAEVLAEAGAKVVVTARSDKSGMAAVDGIKKNSGDAMFCRLDVTREEEWRSAVKKTVEAFGGLDVLVNNAGVSGVSLVENITLEQWHEVMAVNADGVMLGIKHGILAMKPGGIAGKGGSIINVNSICSNVALFSAGPYSASKAAARLLTKVAAIECGNLKYGIRVNSVHPGAIRTEMVVKGFEERTESGAFASPAEAEAGLVALHPIGRLGSTDDVAQAVLYLASDASGFATGSELVIDGGLTAQ